MFPVNDVKMELSDKEMGQTSNALLLPEAIRHAHSHGSMIGELHK
jgi:hypothetical protein